MRCWRFTPTGVGTAISIHSVITPLSVHPHGRGDGDFQQDFRGDVRGSPPRAWGRLTGGGAAILGK